MGPTVGTGAANRTCIFLPVGALLLHLPVVSRQTTPLGVVAELRRWAGSSALLLLVVTIPTPCGIRENETDVTAACVSAASLVRPSPATAGQTVSEGGFAANRVSAASLLDVSEDTDKKGKKYYKYELLVRSGERGRQRGRRLTKEGKGVRSERGKFGM